MTDLPLVVRIVVVPPNHAERVAEGPDVDEAVVEREAQRTDEQHQHNEGHALLRGHALGRIDRNEIGRQAQHPKPLPIPRLDHLGGRPEKHSIERTDPDSEDPVNPLGDCDPRGLLRCGLLPDGGPGNGD